MQQAFSGNFPVICCLNSVKSSGFCVWAGWNWGYRSNVELTSPVCTHKHAVDGEIGNFICWELCVGISEQWNYSLGSSQCFDGARIPGDSRNRGIRLCHPCHSPGFISRKSGNETAFLPPSGTQTGRIADKEGHSHRWDVIWHCADCYLTLCQNI